jgi:hypothetical protein
MGFNHTDIRQVHKVDIQRIEDTGLDVSKLRCAEANSLSDASESDIDVVENHAIQRRHSLAQRVICHGLKVELRPPSVCVFGKGKRSGRKDGERVRWDEPVHLILIVHELRIHEDHDKWLKDGQIGLRLGYWPVEMPIRHRFAPPTLSANYFDFEAAVRPQR